MGSLSTIETMLQVMQERQTSVTITISNYSIKSFRAKQVTEVGKHEIRQAARKYKLQSSIQRTI
jgi:hypothetical protein